MGGVAAVGLGCLAVTGVTYRWTIGKAQKELANALAAIEASMRAFDIFGEGPPRSPSSKSSGGERGDSGFLLGA